MLIDRWANRFQIIVDDAIQGLRQKITRQLLKNINGLSIPEWNPMWSKHRF